MANRKDVDTRIVEMQFDAKDFDKGIRQSTKNLEDFKKQLHFEDAVKQMGEVVGESAPMNKSLADMAKNVAKLANELTGIGSISTYVAQKIKHAWQDAANSMERFVKSMTSDQIKEGSAKYDRLLKSVQTIMNATGDSEEHVYSVMEKLNKYTDETSYNFADMSENIGKFTTAGLELADSEEAMEGIANWAAMAGQNATTASRAMYNISQAIGAGSMKLIDWKSIQNAGMDARWFRQEALDAAVAAGTLKKSKDGLYKTVKGGKQVNLDNFTETLKFGWFDKQTMMTVFKTFADSTQGIGEKAYKAAQRCTTFNDALGAWKDMLSTGWMQSYEHVFGKLSDAMDLFSGICNKVSEQLSIFVELRNGILAGWNAAGGRNSLWGALVGEMETPDGKTMFAGAYGLLDTIQDISDRFHQAFVNFFSRFAADTNKDLYKNNPEYFYGFLSANLLQFTESIQQFTNSVRDFLNEIPAGATESRLAMIGNVIETIFGAVTLVWQVLKGVVGFAKNLLGQLKPTFDAILSLLSYFAQIFNADVENGVKRNVIGSFFQSLAETLRPVTSVVNAVVRVLAGLIAGVVEFARQTGVFKIIGAAFQLLFNYALVKFQQFVDSGIIQMVLGWIVKLVAKIPTLVSLIKDLATAIYSSIKNNKKLQTFVGMLKEVFSTKSLKSLLVSIKNWVVKLFGLIPTMFGSVSGGIGGFFNSILDGFLGLFIGSASADEAADPVAEAIAKPIAELGSSDAVDKAMEAAKPGILTKIKNKVQEIWQNITDFFNSLTSGAFDGVTAFFAGVKAFFAGTTFTDLLGHAKEFITLLSVFNASRGLAGFGVGVKKVGKGINAVGKGLKAIGKGFKWESIGESISGIIESIKPGNGFFSKLGPQLLMVAGAVAILVQVGKDIAAMKPDELKTAGVGLAVLLSGLLTASIVAKHFAGNGGSLLAIAAALWLIMIPMKMLMSIPWVGEDGITGGLFEMVGKLALIMGVMAVAARVAGNVKIKGLVGMAVALNLMLIPLKILSKMALLTYNADGNYIGGLVQAIGSLVVLMLSMAGAARLAGKGAKGFFAMAVALNLLMIPIELLSRMKSNELGQGLGALAGIILGLGALVHVAQQGGANKLGGIVGTIAVLAAIGWLIGKTMNWEQAATGFIPIIAMITFMSIMFKQISKLKAEQIAAAKGIFTAITILVGIIAGAILGLTLTANENTMPVLISFMAGLILVIGAVALLTRQAAKAEPKGILNTAIIMGAIAALAAVAGGALVDMTKNQTDFKLVLSFLLGLAAVIGVIGLVMPAMAKMDFVGMLVAAGGLALAVVAITGALSLMAPVLLGSIGSSMEMMSARLKLMSGLLKDFFDRMDSISDKAIEHTIAIFDQLGDVVGRMAVMGTLGGLVNSFMYSLFDLRKGVDLFFVNDDKIPDPESSHMFGALRSFSTLLPTLAGLTVGNLPVELMYLGVGLGLFNSATSDIDTDNPPALGLLKGIFGEADNIAKFAKLPLDTFTSQMTGLGGAMSLYAKGANEVTGLGEGEDIDVSKSIGILKAVCNAISGEDETGEFKIPDNMPDSTKMGLFAGQLESLGNALSTFAKAAHEMETDTTNAVALLKFLGEIGGYVTTDNLGVVNVFSNAGLDSGSDGKSGKLGQFALDIGALGNALSTFATSIGGKEAAFTTGLGVLEHFQDLNGKLTKDNLAFANVFNDAEVHRSALNTFATDIAGLGLAIAAFATSVQLEDGAQADFNYALRALNFLTLMNTKLSAIKIGTSLHTLIYGEDYTLGQMADDMEILGTSLQDMSNAMTGAGADAAGFNYDGVMQALGAIEEMVKILNQLNILKPETGNWLSIGDYISMLVQIMGPDGLGSTELGERNYLDGSVIDQIAKFAASISSAFRDTEGIDSEAVAMFQQLASSLADLTTIDPSLDFEYPGKMISAGIASGIRNGESEVVNAIVEVVQAAIDAGNETAVNRSPSHVFAEMGEFMAMGLAQGLTNKDSAVGDASSEMVGTAIEKAGLMMGAISAVLSDSLNLQPTITPVLDLSNIAAAGPTLSNMFSGYGLNLSNALERAAAATGSTGPVGVVVQNPVDLAGIQGTVENLQVEIGNLQTAIMNMKIVLNTGVVAGEITDYVDTELARRDLYASRRN